ncbi:MAG: DUF58 domain-containing protein [Nitriliruptoraceae bacterium]
MTEAATAAVVPPRPAPPPPRWSRPWWAGVLPVPTGRLAGLTVVAALAAALLPTVGAWLLAALVVVALIADGWAAPAPWQVGVARSLPPVVPLGGTAAVAWQLENPTARSLTVGLTDEFPPSLGVDARRVRARLPAHGRSRATTRCQPSRRGTFTPAGCTVRVVGPLGLATRQARRSLPGRIEVHPSFRSRDAAELRIRRARILDEGARSVRGRGGGTEFEALREYVEGDEFRHLDWAATARRGLPIVRTFRAERNQTVLVLLDTGRTMAGLVDAVPRLDHAMDATLALATVATHLGDRTGLVAFSADVRALIAPRRDSGQLRRLSGAMHALEPELAEAGYHAAFRTTLARFRRRALLVILTELAPGAVEETLLPALPLLTREHAVVIAAARDPALAELRDRAPDGVEDVYAAAAATQVLDERRRVARRLQAAGARVVDAPPEELAARVCDTYLDVKNRGGW